MLVIRYWYWTGRKIDALLRTYWPWQLTHMARRQSFVSDCSARFGVCCFTTIPFMPTGQQDRLLALWRKAVRCRAGVQPQDDILPLIRRNSKIYYSLYSLSLHLQLVTTIMRHQPESAVHRYSCRNLVFMSTIMAPAGDYSVTLDHFSRRHWLAVFPLLTEHLSCWTCFSRRCNLKFHVCFEESLSLLDSPVSGKNLLQLSFGITNQLTIVLLSFFFFPQGFRVQQDLLTFRYR